MCKSGSTRRIGVPVRGIVLAAAAFLAGCDGSDFHVETVDNLAAVGIEDLDTRFCCEIPSGKPSLYVGPIDINPSGRLAGVGSAPVETGLTVSDVTPAGAVEFRWDGWFVATGHDQAPTAIPDPSDPPDETFFNTDLDVGGFSDPQKHPLDPEPDLPYTLHVYVRSCEFQQLSFTLTVFEYRFIGFLPTDEPLYEILSRQLQTITIVNDPSLCEPPPPPPEDLIVFTRTVDFEDGEIWATDLDGNETQLTDDAFHDFDPVWSPDRTRIAFVSDRAAAGYYEVHLMDPDGNVQRASMFEARWVEDPAFSPDGNEIAVSVGAQGQADKDIWILDLSQPLASRATHLTQGTARDASPAWSPDGQRIAFVRSPGDIYVVKADGSTAPAPLVTDLLAGDLDWSSQGELVFDRYVLASLHYRIWRADGDGMNPRAVTDGGTHFADRSPSWSRAGDRIVFVRDQVNSELPTGVVHVADPAGSNAQPTPGQQDDNRDPDW